MSPLAVVRERMAAAAARSGRPVNKITLIAVTKTVPLDRVQPVLIEGVAHVGENRVQEALAKYEPLRISSAKPPVFHLIGPLQSNKVKKAVGFFDVIQSLDRMDLARDIDRHAAALGKKQMCLIEVKISEEDTKSGLVPEELPQFLEQIREFSSLEIRGLMGIPPLSATGEASRPYFKKLRRLFEDFKKMSPDGSPPTIRGDDTHGFNVLSMGMSSDFEVAIQEGSTMVRIGTAIFGERSRPL